MITQYTRLFFVIGEDTPSHVRSGTLPFGPHDIITSTDDDGNIILEYEYIDVELEVDEADKDFGMGQKVLSGVEILNNARRANGQITPQLAAHPKILKATETPCDQISVAARNKVALTALLNGQNVDEFVAGLKGNQQSFDDLSASQSILLVKALKNAGG